MTVSLFYKAIINRKLVVSGPVLSVVERVETSKIDQHFLPKIIKPKPSNICISISKTFYLFLMPNRTPDINNRVEPKTAREIIGMFPKVIKEAEINPNGIIHIICSLFQDVIRKIIAMIHQKNVCTAVAHWNPTPATTDFRQP